MFSTKIFQLVSAIFVLGACSTTQPTVVQIAPNGQQFSMQLSRDQRSLQAYHPVEAALAAKDHILARKDLTDDLMVSVGELSLIGNKPEEAAMYARTVLKKDFKNINAMKTLVKISLFQKRYEEAILMAENGLQVDPRDADLLSLKGLGYYFLEDSYSARDLWKKAMEVNPTHIPAQMNLAVLYFHNRNIPLAGVAFDKILAMQPQNSDALVGKSTILDLQGRPEEAKKILLTVIKANPKAPLALYNLALIERDRLSNFEAALGYMDTYLQVVQKERTSIERALAMREELRSLVAKKKTDKLSDAQLREIAASSNQVVGSESSQELVQHVAQETTEKVAPAANSRGKEVKTPKLDDQKSLEDQIK